MKLDFNFMLQQQIVLELKKSQYDTKWVDMC